MALGKVNIYVYVYAYILLFYTFIFLHCFFIHLYFYIIYCFIGTDTLAFKLPLNCKRCSAPGHWHCDSSNADCQ